MRVSDAIISFMERTNTRCQQALAKARKSEYGPKEWVSDVVGFWDDVASVVTGMGTEKSTVFFKLGTQTGAKTSGPIPVPTPAAARMTDLVSIGGQRPPISAKDDTFIAVKPSTDDGGAVMIALQNLGKLQPPLKAGDQYVGWLYDDETLLAQVVVVVL